MTYPPPPGPPGPDGWSGGDPNQVPPGQYGGGVPGGYPPQGDPYSQPQGDPYGQPPQGDPYGQPQGDPYNQPASGVPDGYGMPGQDPYGAQASGIPGTNPYSAPPGPPGPPGYGPQQPMIQPPSSNNNTGWIVGGVIGVVVILLAVVGVLYATGAFSPDKSSDTTASDDKSKDKKDDSGKDGKDDGKDSGDKNNSGQYKIVENICDEVDLSGLEDAYKPIEDDPTQQNTNTDDRSQTTCNAYLGSIIDKEYGAITIDVSIYDDETAAAAGFESETSLLDDCDSSDDLDGPWSKGIVATGGKDDCYIGIDKENTGVYVHDGNMSLKVTLGLNGKMADGKGKDLLPDVAEEAANASAE